MSYAHFLDDLLAIAYRAGEAILDIYGQDDFNVQDKADQSPLTAADLASHQIICEGLKALNPSYPILSEESKGISRESRQAWETFWLVDPLDGTKEFIKRNGEFTVNIALVYKGKPVLGLVYAPVMQSLYYALEGEGAFKKQGEAEPVAIKAKHYQSGPLALVASRSHAGAETEAFISNLQHDLEVEHVSKGSALKLCLVAEGVAHLYPRFGPTMEWDTAAAQCVAEAAGASVTKLDGSPLRYNKDDLLNPYFMVSGGFAWGGYL
ncbi:MAG: 3'(2'),5'-bisphosphate nucleotidase CysQ [Deinococcales bacterium]